MRSSIPIFLALGTVVFAGPHTGRNGELTPGEMELARTAWHYFENNTIPATGLANAADSYPSTTMWDTASYLGGLVSARELGLISKGEFDTRLRPLLATFKKLSLFRDELPNKAYNTQTAEKVDYTNKPSEIGFSALDIGRLLLWFKIIEQRYGEYAGDIHSILVRWNYTHVVDPRGTLYGAAVGPDQKTQYLQEGRLGYEEYAAAGFSVWGFNTEAASRPEPYASVPIFGVQIPYDSRDPRKYGAHNYVVSESYVLDGIELNWDEPLDRSTDDRVNSLTWMADFAGRVYRVQEERYRREHILTARTEHQLAGAPYFIYDTVYTDGYPWNTITETGTYVPDMAAVSCKAALGLWVLWETPYTDLLYKAVQTLSTPRGFYEGRFEKSGKPIESFTANNNGIILEALLYKVQGKLLKWGATQTDWTKLVTDAEQARKQGLPGQPRPQPVQPQMN